MPAGAHNCVEPPGQNDPFPVIVQGSGVFAVMVLLHVFVHPLKSVIVTEYVPATLTVMHCVVSPVLH